MRSKGRLIPRLGGGRGKADQPRRVRTAKLCARWVSFLAHSSNPTAKHNTLTK
jgi:hypothetical protein